MKKVSIFIFAGICFLTACGPHNDNTQQVIPPADSGGASSTNMGTNNEQMTRNPGTAVRMGDGATQGNSSDSSENQTDTQR